MWLTCRRPGFSSPAQPKISCQPPLIFVPLKKSCPLFYRAGTIFEKCPPVKFFLAESQTYWSHCIEKEKTRHGSSNDDVINLKAMIERYTFISILHVLWPVTLKFGILGSFMLLMAKT